MFKILNFQNKMWYVGWVGFLPMRLAGFDKCREPSGSATGTNRPFLKKFIPKHRKASYREDKANPSKKNSRWGQIIPHGFFRESALDDYVPIGKA